MSRVSQGYTCPCAVNINVWQYLGGLSGTRLLVLALLPTSCDRDDIPLEWSGVGEDDDDEDDDGDEENEHGNVGHNDGKDNEDSEDDDRNDDDDGEDDDEDDEYVRDLLKAR